MKNLEKQFTFGFEIEGAFRDDLCDKLDKLPLSVNYKTDGSVEVDKDSDFIPDEEITIGVFKSFPKLLKVLEMFENGSNYLENETCGLHIHIKPKGKNAKKIRSVFADYQFLRKIQNYAETELCQRISNRIKSGSYSHGIKNFNSMVNNWKTGSKYIFLRNHPQGTYEFRFFDTCRNKEKNVRKFFKYFFTELEKVKQKKEKVVSLKDIEKDITFDWKVEKMNKKMIFSEIVEKSESRKLEIKVI